MTTLPFQSRAFDRSDAHYQLAGELHSAHWPHLPYSWERTKAYEATKPKDHFNYREFLEVDGSVEALLELSDADFVSTPGARILEICLRQEQKGSDFANACMEYGIELAKKHDTSMLFGFGFTNDMRDIELLQRHGFETAQRQNWTQLLTEKFDPERFREQVEGASARGIRIASLKQLTEEGVDWKRRWYDLCNILFRDVPLPEPHREQPWEEFDLLTQNEKLFNAQGKFLAFSESQDLGVAMLFPAETDPTFAYTGLTAVHRDARRTGLATALKATAIAWGKSVGVKRIVADNERNNPMYLLNLKLGFEDAYEEHFMRLKLRE